MTAATACRCTDPTVECPEGWIDGDDADQACQYCGTLDPYDPCPVRGFGCGSTSDSECDCCTPEQRAEAAR
jgi:hypothetical protein